MHLWYVTNTQEVHLTIDQVTLVEEGLRQLSLTRDKRVTELVVNLWAVHAVIAALEEGRGGCEAIYIHDTNSLFIVT